MDDKKEQKIVINSNNTKTINSSKDSYNNGDSQKCSINSKTVTMVIAVILFVIILVLSLITISSTVKASNLAFGRYRFYIMRADSQPQVAERGDLVIAKKLRSGEIKEGDNIVFGGGKIYYCDSVVETRRVNTVTKMVIAEYDGVKYQFAENEVEGKVIYKVRNLGDIISFLRTPIGMVFFIIFVICIFVLLRIIFLGKRYTYTKDKNMQDTNGKSCERQN